MQNSPRKLAGLDATSATGSSRFLESAVAMSILEMSDPDIAERSASTIRQSLVPSPAEKSPLPTLPTIPGAILRTGAGRALFSADETHRYWLDRCWDETRGFIAFCLLNPSTATEEILDPTLTRCRNYARSWGYGGMVIVNLFSLRSTDPDGLRHDPEPTGGIANRRAIVAAGRACGEVVAGWGSYPLAHGLSGEVVIDLEAAGIKLTCLGHTKGGEPRHPLYLRSDAPRRPARTAR